MLKVFCENVMLFTTSTFPFIQIFKTSKLIDNFSKWFLISKFRSERILNFLFSVLLIVSFFLITNYGPFHEVDSNIFKKILDDNSIELSSQMVALASAAPEITVWLEKIKIFITILVGFFILRTFVFDIANSLNNIPHPLISQIIQRKKYNSALEPSIIIVLGSYLTRLMAFNVVYIIGIRAANNVSFLEFGQTILPLNSNIGNFKSIPDILFYSFNSPFSSPSILVSDNNWVIGSVLLLSFFKLILVMLLLSVFLFILPNIKETIWKSPDVTETKVGSVSITYWKSKINDIVNPGFQSFKRAMSYYHTQDIIVPKSTVFKEYIKILENRFATKNNISILSPGSGTSPFLKYMLNNQNSFVSKRLEFVGVDLSKEMIALGIQEFSTSQESNIDIKLHSGFNLVSKNNEFNKNILDHGISFDAIISTQFDHYFPNSSSSRLSGKLTTQGVQALTKAENYKLYYRLLNQGGIFILFDDFEADSPQETEEWNRTWDTFVAERFSDEGVMTNLSDKCESMYDKIQQIYSTETNDSKIELVKERRIKRREYCLEETRLSSKTVSELEEIFDRVDLVDSLIPELPQFKLIIALKT